MLRKHPALGLAARLVADRRGVSAAIFGVALPALVMAMGVGVDLSQLTVEKGQLQVAADAAVGAAAISLPTPSNVPTAAIAVAEANMPVDANGHVLVAADVVQGVWDAGSATFSSTSAGTKNAVRVTTRRATANGNPHRVLFSGFFGISTIDVSATATALAATSCSSYTNLSLVSLSLPNRTAVVTQGNPCTAASGYTGNCYFATVAGNPIIRVDSAYNGAATVGFSLASPARLFSFQAPARGSYYVVLSDFALPNTGTTTMVFNRVTSNPAAPVSSGTATYVNRWNTVTSLPGTTLCIPGTTRARSKLVG